MRPRSKFSKSNPDQISLIIIFFHFFYFYISNEPTTSLKVVPSVCQLTVGCVSTMHSNYRYRIMNDIFLMSKYVWYAGS